MTTVAAPAALQRNVPLAPLTTIGIGGPATYFVRASTVDEIREGIAWAAEIGEPLFVLAGGSNLLIADEGFDGVVLHLDLRGVTVESEDPTSVIVKVAAGERWDDFVAMAAAKGWAGIECLSGIPGSAGATPIQNVGAYGQDVSETIVRVEVLERDTGRVVTLTNWDCRFAYRSSVFKTAAKDKYVVLAVTYCLKPNGAPAIRYPELQKLVDESATLQQVRDAVITVRKRKGMVIDPADPDTRSDGSFFMNPVLSQGEFERLANREMPHYPSGDEVKLSAAWLIEHAGFHKGWIHGNVGLSTKHTLAIVNRGGGTAREVLSLVQTIQSKVRETFGVELHPEPNFVGFLT
ncbi:MAG: UDP-N-acetylmuramate dehydrogenase [Acidobacteriota bacterium]